MDGEPLPDSSLDGVPFTKEEDIDGVPSEQYDTAINSWYSYDRNTFVVLVFFLLLYNLVLIGIMFLPNNFQWSQNPHLYKVTLLRMCLVKVSDRSGN